MDYLLPKFSLKKNSSGTILTHSWKDKRIYNFLNGISPEVISVVPLEFERTAISPIGAYLSFYYEEDNNVFILNEEEAKRKKEIQLWRIESLSTGIWLKIFYT